MTYMLIHRMAYDLDLYYLSFYTAIDWKYPKINCYNISNFKVKNRSTFVKVTECRILKYMYQDTEYIPFKLFVSKINVCLFCPKKYLTHSVIFFYHKSSVKK